MPYVSLIKFAEKLNVSKQRVSKGIKDGTIATSVRSKKQGKNTVYEIDLEKGLAEWAANIDPSKQRDPAKQNDTKALDANGNSQLSTYQKSKGVKEFYGAKLAQLEYEEKAGRLVPSAQVKAEAYKIARNVRDTLMGLPERVSAELAHMTEPREIAIYLRAQLGDALKDLQGAANVGNPPRK